MIFIVSVRPAPTRPNMPVICPEKTENDVLRTMLPMERLRTLRTSSPYGRVLRSCADPWSSLERFPTDHRVNKPRAIEIAGRIRRPDLAVAQHYDFLQELVRRTNLERSRDS